MPLPSFGRLSSRTNLKPAGGGRHRDAVAKSDDVDPEAEDHEFTSYLAALAPDSDQESTGSGRRFGDAQVHQLRLNLIASQQLKEIADARGTSPQALAQEWVLERLAWESQAASDQRRQHPQQAHQPPHSPQWPQAGHQQPRRGAVPETPESQTDQHFFENERWSRPVRGSLA